MSGGTMYCYRCGRQVASWRRACALCGSVAFYRGESTKQPYVLAPVPSTEAPGTPARRAYRGHRRGA